VSAAEGGGRSFTTRVVDAFLGSNFSLLLILICLGLGAVALIATPREEDPQIVVPFVDVFVEAPGIGAAEVERLAAEPLERLMLEIPGVEHVYSRTEAGGAMVTVRFEVGEDRERALVDVYNKIQANQHLVPPQVAGWSVQPVEIDDVPILTLTLFATDPAAAPDLVRYADELAARLQTEDDVSHVGVHGGEPRVVRVLLDPEALRARGVAPLEVAAALRRDDVRARVGTLTRRDGEVAVEVGSLLKSADEVADTVVRVVEGRPLRVRDLGTVVDGPEEPRHHVWIAFGGTAPAVEEGEAVDPEWVGGTYPAVTLSVAKRRGTNAVDVARDVRARFAALADEVLPPGVHWRVTRDHGATANEKVNELVAHLLIAVGTIVVLVGASLGWRAAFVVALAVPLTLAVTLFADLVLGFTINRVTLFALILSLGLLVDDPIVDVENIHRHLMMRRKHPRQATLDAVEEVRPPVILATLAVIFSFLPMFFVGGMMGPYMRPMPFNVSTAMFMSLLIAFTVTPWASYHLLKRDAERGGADPHAEGEGFLVAAYRKVAHAILGSRRRSKWLLVGSGLAFVGSVAMAGLGLVPVKMLPFDNKSEFQVVVDAPEGTPVEDTDRVLRDLARALREVPEVVEIVGYSGTPSPHDFNGMVRHDFLRRMPYQGDLRVVLTPRHERGRQAHAIALAVRPALEEVAARHGVRIGIVEPPPGPPVLAGVVAEVYGPETASAEDLERVALEVKRRFDAVPFLRDVDAFVAEDRPRLRLVPDRDEAALRGVSPAAVAETVRMALSGLPAAVVHEPDERRPLEVRLELPRPERSALSDLLALGVPTPNGVVPLEQVVRVVEDRDDRVRFRKDLRPLQYVVGEAVGDSPVDAVLALNRSFAEDPLPEGYEASLTGEGELQITLEVFRDLGLAFAAALVAIYVLLVAQTGSFALSGIIMLAIPLTMIGVFPGFWLLNVLAAGRVGEFPNPIFFTATGMIGVIALAGIVVRNSIILIDFIEHNRAAGMPTGPACIEAGCVRLRPIFLTAGAAVMGAWVIVFDPIFSGLAWSFVFGILASTAFTLLVVPAAYALLVGHRPPRRAAPPPSGG